MFEGNFRRGFSVERLKSTQEPKVHYDEDGFFIYTLSENVKVYFDDYYIFLEKVSENCSAELSEIEEKLESTAKDMTETFAYYSARKIIIDLVLRTARNFYTDSSSFGVVMTPWCFGTVLLEKAEIYRDRMAKGEIDDQNMPEYPYYVIKYLDEIYRKTLLDVFNFPEEAFKMRWQYSELLKRYSKVLTNISKSLSSVLMTIKNYGT